MHTGPAWRGRAKRALHEIRYAECREDAETAMERFASEYGAKYPNAVETLRRDQDCLLTFFDFPAEHWQHLRTTNAIESTFATVRLRQRVTEGAGSRTKALLMAFKLLDMAQKRWQRVNAPHLVALVREGFTIHRRNSDQERCLIGSTIHNSRQYLARAQPLVDGVRHWPPVRFLGTT